MSGLSLLLTVKGMKTNWSSFLVNKHQQELSTSPNFNYDTKFSFFQLLQAASKVKLRSILEAMLL